MTEILSIVTQRQILDTLQYEVGAFPKNTQQGMRAALSGVPGLWNSHTSEQEFQPQFEARLRAHICTLARKHLAETAFSRTTTDLLLSQVRANLNLLGRT